MSVSRDDADRRTVTLEQGSGGSASRGLVERVIFPRLRNPSYRELSDAAAVDMPARALFTTDTYVVDPPFFPGGDIGKLAVFGTCNDLAVSGGAPRFLSLALVIEEGFAVADLERILDSAARASAEVGVRIVTGDTKDVPRGRGGGVFVNTAGVGERLFPFDLSPARIAPGDAVVVSGPVGAHGLAVLAAREGLRAAAGVSSDCANLDPLCRGLHALGDGLRFMRDATRGGVAAILNEIVSGAAFGIEVREEAFAVSPEVRTISEILGLNVLEIANEGVFVAVVAAALAPRTIELLRGMPNGREAAIVGAVTSGRPGKVVALTAIGGRRILDWPRGLLLPRIC